MEGQKQNQKYGERMRGANRPVATDDANTRMIKAIELQVNANHQQIMNLKGDVENIKLTVDLILGIVRGLTMAIPGSNMTPGPSSFAGTLSVSRPNSQASQASTGVPHQTPASSDED